MLWQEPSNPPKDPEPLRSSAGYQIYVAAPGEWLMHHHTEELVGANLFNGGTIQLYIEG